MSLFHAHTHSFSLIVVYRDAAGRPCNSVQTFVILLCMRNLAPLDERKGYGRCETGLGMPYPLTGSSQSVMEIENRRELGTTYPIRLSLIKLGESLHYNIMLELSFRHSEPHRLVSGS